MGGLLALFPLVVGLETESELFSNPALNGVVLLCISGLMVSKVPTLAVKQVRIPGRYRVFVLLGVGCFAAFLISTPWITLAVAGVAYLVSIPYSIVLYRRLEKHSPEAVAIHEQEDVEDDEDDKAEDEHSGKSG